MLSSPPYAPSLRRLLDWKGRGSMSREIFSSKRTNWETPQTFFNALDAEFHFTLDAAASAGNAKCFRYLSKRDDGLHTVTVWPLVDIPGGSPVGWREHPKFHHNIWCNPPYGRKVGKWFAKAREAQAEGATVVMLVPARTDTRWWHEHVQGIASEIRFIKGRIRFVGGKAGATFPSVVIVYRGKP